MDKKNKQTIIILVLIVFFCISNYLITREYKQLPSPLYGGDYYYQLGATNHVKYGGSPLESPNIKDSLPVYMVTYSFFTGNIAKIFNYDAIKSELIFSYLIMIFSVIIVYFLSNNLFNNESINIIAVLIYININNLPILKYTNFTYFVFIPLLFLLLFKFIKKQTYKNAILLGICYGIIGLSHSIAFISSTFLLLLGFIYYGTIKKINSKKELIKYFAIIFTIGTAIALLWWFDPIFKYHGHTSANYTEWNNGDWGSIKLQFNFLISTLKSLFLNVSTLKNICFSLIASLGVLGLFVIKTKNEEMQKNMKFIKFLFISGVIITFHYFITKNVLNFQFIPGYISYFLIHSSIVFVMALTIYYLNELIKKNLLKKYFFVIVICILIIFQITGYFDKQNDKWQNSAKNELPEHLIDLSKYLNRESNLNDVIITTKETGFAINALSGRKLVSSRRAHNDPFLNLDTRELSQSIILYGNNTEQKKELIKKYDVKYLYWDYYWVQSEYSFDNKGNLVSWFDPLILFNSKEYRDILSKNNIKYFVQNTYVDPALQGENFPKFDLIFISPDNYHNQTNPWNPNLNPYLEEVWSYEVSGQKIAKLYKVNIE